MRPRLERVIDYHTQQILNTLYPPVVIEPGLQWECPDCGAPAHELCYANCPRYREDPEVPGE